jgi:hypothetical protein
MGKGALRVVLQEGLGKMPDLTRNGLLPSGWEMKRVCRSAPAGPGAILGCFVICWDLSSGAVAQALPQAIEE